MNDLRITLGLVLFIVLAFHARALSQNEPSSTAESATTPEAKPGLDAETKASELEDIDLLTMEIPVVTTATRREQKITAVPYAMSLYPGAKVVESSGSGYGLYLETKSTGYPLRGIARHGNYDGVWGTGGNSGVYGDTTGTTSNDSGVFGPLNE